MDNLSRIIGLILVVAGFYALVSLAGNFEDLIYGFKESPLHLFVMENIANESTIKYGDIDIVLPEGFFNLVSLFFGFMFLGLWLRIGATMLHTGSKLASHDMQVIGKKIDDLKEKMKDIRD